MVAFPIDLGEKVRTDTENANTKRYTNIKPKAEE